ncbi:MAG: 3-isopropylmalate dehydratase small subunit [Planctomycetaceae bacterium]|jgi:3-isopropylmalate/(R)-2-methylmalate dehydratase small subunit|nr:3-isopropylmalate dehydratase small subunit [Planctomycetaceae bacterium]
MQPFVKYTGVLVPMNRSDVDTDQIMPKQFLKRIERSGFGQFLFFDWRFLPDGSENPDFELNQPEYRNATILLARNNFGCGSSREHAPWGLADYGFRVVIAPSFADIFYNNSFKNGILLIKLSDEQIESLFQLAAKKKPLTLTIDLENKQIMPHCGLSFAFELDDFRRNCLLQGLDDIALTLQYEADIVDYEKKHGIIS